MSFIHVSTAFSNCVQKEINECYYTPPMTGENIKKLVQIVEDKKLDPITNTLLEDFPNTYTYTKCIAEDLVREFGRNLPFGIFRPAIIVSAYREPLPGWVDNYFGPTGVLAGGGAGLLRVLYVDVDCTAELVPVDLTVNALIATAWDVAKNKKENEDPPIYNYTANWNGPLTWRKYIDLALKYAYDTPTIYSIWCYIMITTKSLYLYYLLTTLLHIIPGAIMDVMFFALRKEIRVLKAYQKIHNLAAVTSFFAKKSWKFNNLNTRTLWHKLSVEDQETFNFSMKDFDWNDYMRNCVRGIRTFIFKDSIDTIPLARKRMKRFFILHNIIKYTLIGFLLWLLYSVISIVMTMSANIGFATISDSVSIR